MKKILTVLICMILAVGVFPQAAIAGAEHWADGLTADIGFMFDGGTGAADDPFIIRSALSLAQLAVNVNDPVMGTDYSGVYFKLGGDIDLGGKEWTPIGRLDASFCGNFDGGGYAVQNMIVNMPSESSVGLFGSIKNAAINRLGVTNCDVTGKLAVGGLAGIAHQSISITNCYTTGTVEAVVDSVTPANAAGGLLGGAEDIVDVVINGCASSAKVSGEEFIGGLIGFCSDGISVIKSCATGNVSGTVYVGGLIGVVYSNALVANLVNCYAKGEVTAVPSYSIAIGSAVGGFIGGAWVADGLSIHNCFATGKVMPDAGTTYVGGFFGGGVFGPFATLDFDTCYFDKTVSGREAAGIPMDTGSVPMPGVDGLTTASMKGADTLTNAAKMDALDSGDGAPVADTPIWYPHSADYPDFKQEFCSVTFDSQSADTAASPPSRQVALNATVGTLPVAPVKSGFLFGGWYTAPEGAGTAFSADTVITGNITVFAKWTLKLMLSSSVSDSTIFTSGRVIITPNIDGGAWQWDKDYLSATFNSPATFTGLKAGTTTVTYTVNGQTASYTITILASGLPATGQDYALPTVLGGLGLAGIVLLGSIQLLRRKRTSTM